MGTYFETPLPEELSGACLSKLAGALQMISEDYYEI